MKPVKEIALNKELNYSMFPSKLMKRNFWIALAASVAIAAALLFMPINVAIAQVPPPGTFSATRTCEAPRSIDGVNPGNVRVSKGQDYPSVGFNSEERKFVQIEVPGANPKRRWVSTSCGTFSEVTPSPTSVGASIPPSSLLPFFDTVNNPEQHNFPRERKEDITPPAPQLNEFDRAVLKTCGAFDTKVKASDFKQLMLDYPDVLRNVKQAVGGQLNPVRISETEFRDDLTSIWSKREGFKHIFCGEKQDPKKPNDDIGGLHFAGRYLQLQESGIGGRLPNNLGKEEVIPGAVYTLGAIVKEGDRILKDDLKGYGLLSNAEELLVDATKAYKAQGNAQGACVLPVRDRETGKSFSAVFVKDTDAIVTFYPDATPGGNPCRN